MKSLPTSKRPETVQATVKVAAHEQANGSTPGNANPQLRRLMESSGLWRASRIGCDFQSGIPTGFSDLDPLLPGHGWPADGVTELLCERRGIGELRLLMPALARLSQQANRWILWVNPPCIPYPPALAAAGINLASLMVVRTTDPRDQLWTLEQALTSSACSAVLAWPARLQPKEIRRLQVAGKGGRCWQVLFRPGDAASTGSPAELRIHLKPARQSPLATTSALALKVIKRRGGWESGELTIPFADDLLQQTPYLPDLEVSLPAAIAGPAATAPMDTITTVRSDKWDSLS